MECKVEKISVLSVRFRNCRRIFAISIMHPADMGRFDGSVFAGASCEHLTLSQLRWEPALTLFEEMCSRNATDVNWPGLYLAPSEHKTGETE